MMHCRLKLILSKNRTQEEIDARKINYQGGSNPILVNDPDLPDLVNEFDQLQQDGAISAQEREMLIPYEQSRPLASNELGYLIGWSWFRYRTKSLESVTDNDRCTNSLGYPPKQESAKHL